mgnify:CR=1 FL=1
MKELIDKTMASLHREGPVATVKKVKNYIQDHARNKTTIENSFVDVLFINGCILPHPMRYRVSHQVEQLLMANVTSSTVYYENLSLEMVNLARVFVFFRCPYTETVGQFISQAKKYNKTVIFDIDDLVFDRVYTDNIKYVQQMGEADRKLYNDGVERIGQTLKLCDIAITTTEALAEELKKYVEIVYVNRNVASDEMLMHSDQALDMLAGKKIATERQRSSRLYQYLEKKDGQISLGYFSGSITHNDDFAIVLPVITRIMRENSKVHLYLVGELDLPQELEPFKDRIHAIGFMDWKKLPFVIAQMDLNLAPLEDTVFNRAKSENKWTEASLVKVVSIASDTGAFHTMIQDGETGILCQNTQSDWYQKLMMAINDQKLRKRIGEKAHRYVKEHCITIETSYEYGRFIKSVMTPNIMFKIPTAQIGGGNLVARRHAMVLQETGMDVSFINDGGEEITNFRCEEREFPVIRGRSTAIFGSIDRAVATLYTTVDFVQTYPNIKNRFYLVQGMETIFPAVGTWGRIKASQSYIPIGPIRFITVSKWCQQWLGTKYHVKADYVPNGLDCNLFRQAKRDFTGKIRILIEGNSEDPNKNTDESFRIVRELDKERYEVWYISSLGKPKDWYQVDRFFRKVPNEKMPEIYRRCHILLKSSISESFSYPPLEMMATGGLSVVRKNEGNVEYLESGENCLFYDPEHLSTARIAIERLVSDEELRKKLIVNGMKTAKERDWKGINEEIRNLYT